MKLMHRIPQSEPARFLTRSLFLLGATLALTTACNKSAPTTPNYADAINSYYQAHPACLWTDEKKFPVQSAPDDAKTEHYDALTDAGLLTRTTSEKKIIIVSKRENNYDLSDQGRSAWVADANQPGYGNFCYGHRKVASVDSNSPTSNQPGATVSVNYHYTLTDLPSWASSQETQTAFPQLQAANTPQPATATLTNTNNGWQVSGAGATSAATDNPDSRMVR
jgi:hypothetical protein